MRPQPMQMPRTAARRASTLRLAAMRQTAATHKPMLTFELMPTLAAFKPTAMSKPTVPHRVTTVGGIATITVSNGTGKETNKPAVGPTCKTVGGFPTIPLATPTPKQRSAGKFSLKFLVIEERQTLRATTTGRTTLTLRVGDIPAMVERTHPIKLGTIVCGPIAIAMRIATTIRTATATTGTTMETPIMGP